MNRNFRISVYGILQTIFLLLSTYFPLLIFSQPDSAAIRFARIITAESVKKHLLVLASDEYEGRETGKDGQKKAARYIAEHFQKTGLKSATDSSYLQKFLFKGSLSDSTVFSCGTALQEGEEIYSENVLGIIEGKEFKDEIIFITAHYDHLGVRDGKIFNGADDNASGTAAVMEIARAFEAARQSGSVPKRTIVCMTVSGEEKGLLGSSYYIENLLFPIENTVCDLNIDMIGRGDSIHKNDSNFVYIIGSDKISTELHRINENANSTYTHLKLDYTFNEPDDPNRFYERSDHYNFAKKGVPVIFYFNGTHEDYHQETDEIEKINFPLLAKRAQLVFFTAWELANRKERIRADVIIENGK